MFKTLFIILILAVNLQCRTAIEIINGRMIPYSGTIKNFQCISRQESNEIEKLEKLEKFFCILDLPISFSFDTAFLVFTLPIWLSSKNKE
jgi:uncharacterized protein YceK